jgi:fructose/tagatose bisphosphate aldolase
MEQMEHFKAAKEFVEKTGVDALAVAIGTPLQCAKSWLNHRKSLTPEKY